MKFGSGSVALEFELERNGIMYKIEIVDDTAKKNRYNIIATNLADPTDHDYLSMP